MWQEPQFALAGWWVVEVGGGDPWQPVQESLPAVAQEIAVGFWFPPGKLPWQ